MRKLFLATSTALLAGLITSCSIFSTSEMDTVEGTQEMINALKDNVDTTEYKPIRVSFSEIESLSNKVGSVQIELVSKKDNQIYNTTLLLSGPGKGTKGPELSNVQIRKYKFDEVIPVNIASINADTLVKHYNSAKTMIPKEYNIKSVASYTYTSNQGELYLGKIKKPAYMEQEFKLAVTEKGKSSHTEGRRRITDYYEIPFSILDNGTIEMQE